MNKIKPWAARAGIVLGFLIAIGTGLEYRVIASALHVNYTAEGISPKTLTTSVGNKVKIDVTNRDKSVHNFVIPDYFIFTSNLKPGEHATVEFDASKKGRFAYYSDYSAQGEYGHPEPGFAGTLVVQ